MAKSCSCHRFASPSLMNTAKSLHTIFVKFHATLSVFSAEAVSESTKEEIDKWRVRKLYTQNRNALCLDLLVAIAQGGWN